jgi:hypothetical protein
MRRKTATSATSPPGEKQQKEPVRVVLGASTRNSRPISDDAIRLLAYQKWEVAGKPCGDGTKFWLEAECELRHGKTDLGLRFPKSDMVPQC